MALGARAGAIVRMVLGQAVMLTAAGAVVGVALANIAGRFVEPLLFHTSPRDPVVLVVVVSVIFAVSVVASILPAWRATRVDPVAALRME